MTVLKQSVIPWGTSNWPPDGPDHTPAPSGLELAPESLCASLRCPGGLGWCNMEKNSGIGMRSC